jgi:hypothetical protein
MNVNIEKTHSEQKSYASNVMGPVGFEPTISWDLRLI